MRLDSSILVEARLAWALVWIGVMIFLFALLFGFLNPHVGMMLDTGANATNATVAGNGTQQAAELGRSRVAMAWKLSSLWFSVGLLYFGFRRAINESRRTP